MDRVGTYEKRSFYRNFSSELRNVTSIGYANASRYSSSKFFDSLLSTSQGRTRVIENSDEKKSHRWLFNGKKKRVDFVGSDLINLAGSFAPKESYRVEPRYGRWYSVTEGKIMENRARNRT